MITDQFEGCCDTFSHLEEWISCQFAASAPGPRWNDTQRGAFYPEQKILRLLQTSTRELVGHFTFDI